LRLRAERRNLGDPDSWNGPVGREEPPDPLGGVTRDPVRFLVVADAVLEAALQDDVGPLVIGILVDLREGEAVDLSQEKEASVEGERTAKEAVDAAHPLEVEGRRGERFEAEGVERGKRETLGCPVVFVAEEGRDIARHEVVFELRLDHRAPDQLRQPDLGGPLRESDVQRREESGLCRGVRFLSDRQRRRQ